ncbi:MAG: HAD-IB family hydrolase [Actinomycetales bacterium]|nr:MAG: HAD-IB family hydrolase [Actinomycetales bacterium]
MQLSEQLRRIAEGPQGPEIGVFFDLDGTLVSGYTASAFFAEGVRTREVGLRDAAKTLAAAVDGTKLGGSPTKASELAFAALAGRQEDSLVDLGERLFLHEIAQTIRPQARQLVRAHRQAGHTIAISSAATAYQVAPVARDLGIKHLVCTRLEVKDGVLTGAIEGRMLWGPEKGKGVRAFARTHGIDLLRSYGYGNGTEDVAFLATVGSPVALNPESGLEQAARRNGWPVLALDDPQDAEAVGVVRTLAALGGFNAGAVIGSALGLATGNRSLGVNAAVAFGCDSVLRLGGIQIDVTGRELLEPSRPAIVVANHQSALDPVFLGVLLRRDFTIVAKKEARYDLRGVLGSALLDPVFIDRSNSDQAKASLAAVAQRIEAGTSLVIFPEGTRSSTPRLLPFRKGAFHLAAETGAPVLPIVLCNVGEVLPKHGHVIRPGVVRIRVLEPRSGWTTENLDEQIDALHADMQQVLTECTGVEAT